MITYVGWIVLFSLLSGIIGFMLCKLHRQYAEIDEVLKPKRCPHCRGLLPEDC